MRRSNVDSSKITDVNVIEDLGMHKTEYGNISYHSEKITCKVSGKPKKYIRNSFSTGAIDYMIE